MLNVGLQTKYIYKYNLHLCYVMFEYKINIANKTLFGIINCINIVHTKIESRPTYRILSSHCKSRIHTIHLYTNILVF